MSIDTVNDLPPRVQYVASASQTVFPYPFPIFQDADLTVEVDGAVQTLTTHYTVSGEGDDTGGDVTFGTGRTPGQIVTIYRATVFERDSDFQLNGPMFSTSVNDELDKLMIIAQELRSSIKRCLRLPNSSEVSDSNIELTPISSYFNKYLSFDSTGRPVPADLVSSGTITGQIIGALINPRTAAEIAADVTPSDYSYVAGDVRRYGAVGDGATNNTTALTNAAASLGVGGTLAFEPAGVYMVDATVLNGILFSGKTGFKILGNGATIKVLDGQAVAGNREVLTFTSCTDGYIENLKVDANRANRTPAEVGAHNIYISTSCARLHFKNVRADNGVCDGWYVSTTNEATQATYPTDIVLEDCHADNAARNGASIISSVRLRVIRGRYTNSNGIAPEYGIDIEPDASTTHANQDLLIDGTEFTGNDGYGLAVARSGGSVLNERIKFKNISGSNNDEGLISVNAVNDIDIDGVNCWAHATALRGLVDIGVTAVSNVSLKNLEFRGITASDAADYCVYIHSGVSGRVSIDGLKANTVDCTVLIANRRVSLSNVDIVDCDKDPAISLIAGSFSTARRITVDDCSGRALYITAPDCEISEVTVIDAASTTAAIHWDTGSTRAVARNVSIYQSVSVPVGSVAMYFAAAPKLVSNVHAQSAGTDYTAANIFNFAAALSGSKVFDCTPHPFSATFTWDPASVAVGGSTNTTATVNGVTVGAGWFVQVMPGVAPQGLCTAAYVDANNTVRVVANNNTGGAIDLASSSWQVYCEKR